MDAGEDFAAIFNLCEGSLWLVIAAVIAWKLRKSAPAARIYWLLPPAFFVFGISDFIESRTGAFWDPWWLLVMKTVCVIVFVVAGLRYRRDKICAGVYRDAGEKTISSSSCDSQS